MELFERDLFAVTMMSVLADGWSGGERSISKKFTGDIFRGPRHLLRASRCCPPPVAAAKIEEIHRSVLAHGLSGGERSKKFDLKDGAAVLCCKEFLRFGIHNRRCHMSGVRPSGYNGMSDRDRRCHMTDVYDYPGLSLGQGMRTGGNSGMLDRDRRCHMTDVYDYPANIAGQVRQTRAINETNDQDRRCHMTDVYDYPVQFEVFPILHEEQKRPRMDIVVLAGSTPQGVQWGEAVFCFDLEAADAIVDAMADGTLFKLEHRSGGGDFNSAVVLTSDSVRQYLRRVDSDVYGFDFRPLLEPREPRCTSDLRMYKYAELMCEYGLSVLGAATATRCYFGAAFDRAFPNYKRFSDLLLAHRGDKRGKFCDVSPVELCRITHDLMARTNDASGFDRLYCYAIGGNSPGGYEVAGVAGENWVLGHALEYTRHYEGAMVVFPVDAGNEVCFVRNGRYDRHRMDQVRDFACGCCRVDVGAVSNGFEVVCVNQFLNGGVSYGVRRVGSQDDELEIKWNHGLFPQTVDDRGNDPAGVVPSRPAPIPAVAAPPVIVPAVVVPPRRSSMVPTPVVSDGGRSR